MRKLVLYLGILLAMLLLLPAPALAQGSTVFVLGRLTDEGIECQALRTDNGELFTLLGDLRGFRRNNRLIVTGTLAELSICQQGTTIVVQSVSDASLLRPPAEVRNMPQS